MVVSQIPHENFTEIAMVLLWYTFTSSGLSVTAVSPLNRGFPSVSDHVFRLLYSKRLEIPRRCADSEHLSNAYTFSLCYFFLSDLLEGSVLSLTNFLCDPPVLWKLIGFHRISLLIKFCTAVGKPANPQTRFSLESFCTLHIGLLTTMGILGRSGPSTHEIDGKISQAVIEKLGDNSFQSLCNEPRRRAKFSPGRNYQGACTNTSVCKGRRETYWGDCSRGKKFLKVVAKRKY